VTEFEVFAEVFAKEYSGVVAAWKRLELAHCFPGWVMMQKDVSMQITV
jgi:hypothetical protein